MLPCFRPPEFCYLSATCSMSTGKHLAMPITQYQDKNGCRLQHAIINVSYASWSHHAVRMKIPDEASGHPQICGRCLPEEGLRPMQT